MHDPARGFAACNHLPRPMAAPPRVPIVASITFAMMIRNWNTERPFRRRTSFCRPWNGSVRSNKSASTSRPVCHTDVWPGHCQASRSLEYTVWTICGGPTTSEADRTVRWGFTRAIVGSAPVETGSSAGDELKPRRRMKLPHQRCIETMSLNGRACDAVLQNRSGAPRRVPVVMASISFPQLLLSPSATGIDQRKLQHNN